MANERTTGNGTATRFGLPSCGLQIPAVLDYIERHLTEVLCPESIAGSHFLSTSQLYRDFYATTGHSVKEYIRKRRISCACEKIKHSDLPLSIIADESGCETQQAFHKLFKNIVGLTPLEYKESETYFYFPPFSSDEVSIAIKVGTETIPTCTTTRFYDSCLIGIEDKAIAALGNVHSRVFGRNGKQIGKRLCYEVMCESGNNEPAKQGFYATCTVNYIESDINAGWDYLYNIWLSGSMFEQSDEGYFEEYLFKNGSPHKLKLYLPVKKRKTGAEFLITQMSEQCFVTARAKGYNAERAASEKVMVFLQKHFPLLIRNARRFYVSADSDTYECGVECGADFTLPTDCGLIVRHIPTGRFAVLPDTCLGDIRIGAAKLETWLTNNAFSCVNEPPFAVYETLDDKYDTEHIGMKICKQLRT